MSQRYIDLIQQTYNFPQNGFSLREGRLFFHGVNLEEIVKEYGTPLRIAFLPSIGHQIRQAQTWFSQALKANNCKAAYNYTFCTKSSHFSFVMEEVLRNGAHLEISSAYDIDIIERLYLRRMLDKSCYIICNGYKMPRYTQRIAKLINLGFQKVIPILDNVGELEDYRAKVIGECDLGIRIATEEQPEFGIYTSRLGIRRDEIIEFAATNLPPNGRMRLKMLHFFINSGITDSTYYWNELSRAIDLYIELKQSHPTLDCLNIGGGFPVRNSLEFEYDYPYMVNEIVGLIVSRCRQADVEVPELFTEFGNYTVGESGMLIFKLLGEKLQNDRERWYMIDNSLMSTLPDIHAMNQQFLVLPINKWNNKYNRVNIGGLSCDQMDYYNQEVNRNDVYLPETDLGDPLYIGFFGMGAYQEALSGYGGLKHCLIPSPRFLLIDRDEEGQMQHHLFEELQESRDLMKMLGY